MKTSLKTVFLLSAVTVLSGCPDSGGSKGNAGPVTTAVHAGQCNYDVISAYNNIRNSETYGNYQYLNQECTRLQNLLGVNTCDMPINTGYNNGYNNGYPNGNGYNNGYNNGYPGYNNGYPNGTTTTVQAPMTTISFADVQSICTAAASGSQPGPTYPTPTIPGQPTNPNQPIAGMKNFSCRLEVRNGSSYGDTGSMNIPIPQGGGQYDVFANVIKNKSIMKFFNYTSFSTSIKFGKMKVVYLPANSLEGDRMELRAIGIDGYKNASIMGFAGQEVSLEVTPKDEFSQGTYMHLSCVSTDATNPGPMISNGSKYACRGEEKQGSRVKRIAYVNEISDLINAGLRLTNNLYAQGEVSGMGLHGSVSMNYDIDMDSSVNVRSYLGTPVAFSSSDSNYGSSVKVNCRITR